ncbi:hypothetical protein DL89DRAFT_266669, partial [Linderina pennispora]
MRIADDDTDRKDQPGNTPHLEGISRSPTEGKGPRSLSDWWQLSAYRSIFVDRLMGVFELTTRGYTRLCGVTELNTPNNPKERVPALLTAVPV